MRRLDFGTNLLTEVEFPNMPELNVLFLSFNSISIAKLHNLKQLQAVYISHNLLTELTVCSNDVKIIGNHKIKPEIICDWTILQIKLLYTIIIDCKSNFD